MKIKIISITLLICLALTVIAGGIGGAIIESFGAYQKPLVDVSYQVDNDLERQIMDIQAMNEKLAAKYEAKGKFGVKKITLCGERLDVPIYLYAACKGFLLTIPVGCTVANVASAGTACATAIALSTVACGASIASVTKIAKACVGL